MLVSICVPAYNAQSTLNETLLSIRRQTYEDFEVFVIDDGSSDGTADIAATHASSDRRFRLISKSNGGVASARNLALAAAKGIYFANLDADDVWHSNMLEKQIETILNEREVVTVSYTWFAYIDERGRIFAVSKPEDEGNVIRRMCRGNLVGNGSSALMHTETLRAIGGWDPTLLGRNDDYNTFFALAELGKYTVVRSLLLGYRQVTGPNMTGNAELMLKSYDEVVRRYSQKYNQFKDEFKAGRYELIAYLLDKAVLGHRWSAIPFLLKQARLMNKVYPLKLISSLPTVICRMILPQNFRSQIRRDAEKAMYRGKYFSEEQF